MLVPTLVWHQNNDNIYITVELNNVCNETINIINNKFNFNAVANNKEYEIIFDLYENIKDFTVIVDEGSVKINLIKEDNEYWRSLTKDKNIYKNNIKINWNYWINELDDSDEEVGGMEEMMKGMGGMGGVKGLGGMEVMMEGMGGMEEMRGSNVNDLDYLDDINDDENECSNEDCNNCNNCNNCNDCQDCQDCHDCQDCQDCQIEDYDEN